MFRKFLHRAMLFLIFIELLLPIFDPGGAKAAASSITLYYNFEQGIYSASSVAAQFSSSGTKTFTKDVTSLVGGTITGVTLNNQGGSGGNASFTATTITLTSLAGGSSTVYGKSETNPMHQIYRQPSGKIWEHKGSKTIPVEFDGASGNPSPYPGAIPLWGRKRYTLVDNFNYGDSSTFGPDLRYSFQSPLYRTNGASGDKEADYGKEGYAVTTAYEVSRATKWYLNQSSVSLSGLDADITDPDKLDQNSISIIGAEKPSAGYGATPLAYGKGDFAGTGMIRTMMLLDGTVPANQIHDSPDSDGSGGLSRNYEMFAIGLWSGTTYKYQMSIDVSYTAPVKADLAYVSIDAGACVPQNVNVNITIKFKNIGVAIPNGDSFSVTLAADGTVFKTFTYSSGLGAGQTITESVPYTFSSMKSITMNLDSNDDIPEASSSNNILTQIITPQASCTPSGGNFNGTTSADKPSIPWKDSNLIKADWTIPSGCTPVQGRFILSQTTGAYIQYGWSSLSSTSVSDMSIFAYGMMGFTGYPGNITSGEVVIEYKLEDSCGGTSYFYEGKFTVGPKPPNRPPQFEIGWFPDNDYYSRTPIAEVVVGDKLNVRLLPEIAPNHYDPDDDIVTFEWLFPSSSSTWIKSFPSMGYLKGEDKLTWLTASTAGDHTITAKMCDDKGACTQKDATITVMRPEPIPCINVPNRVVQNRPLPANAINGACSKPARNRTITEYFWTNNLPVYPNVGIETVTLEVKDNYGVRSLPENIAIKNINVVEDKPPVAVINLPIFAVRGIVPFRDMSYSPDGDVIVETSITYVYDSNDDGIFNDHMPLNIPISVGGPAILTTPKVGKYKLTVKTKEDWGLTNTRSYVVDIKNDSPEVSFTVTSANPEPPMFHTTSENEMLMAYGGQWQGSSLTNPNLNKVKDIGFTYNTASSGLTAHYGKQPFNGPATGLTITPEQYQKTTYNAWHTFPVPQLFNTQFLGNRYGVGSIGSIPFFDGTNTRIDGGLGNTYDYSQQKYIPNKPTPDNPGKFLAYDAKGGAYSVDFNSGYYNDNDYSETWTIYRKTADGVISWSRSGQYNYDGCSGDCSSSESGVRSPHANLKLNNDGTKVSLGGTYSYGCWCVVTTWLDVETGLEVPANTITPAPTLTGIYEDSEVYLYREQPMNLTTDTYSSGSWGSISNRAGTVSEYFVSYNKQTGVTKKIEIYKDIYFNNRSRSEDGSVIRGDGSDSDSSTLIDVNYSVSADGYVYIVDGMNKIVVADKYANQLASYTTKGTRPTNTFSHEQTLQERFRYTVSSAGLSADGEFQVVLQEEHYKLRRWNFQWTSCAPCSVGSYVSHYDEDDSQSERKFYNYKINGGTTIPSSYALAEIGQTMKKDTSVADADYVFDFLQSSVNTNVNAPSGLIFRAADNNTMYRLEFTTNKISLSKLVGGMRTELRSTPVWLSTTSFNNMKVSVRGGKIKVRMGTVPIMEVTDLTLTEGTYGFFIGGYGSHFRNFYVKVPIVDNNKISDTGIAGEELTYSTEFMDPESDDHLISKDKWKYEHTNSTKFLDSGDGKSGLSAYNNQTINGDPIKTLDKVGVYKLTFIGADDPTPVGFKYPNSAFAEYLSESDPYSRNVLIHRRPIGVLNVNQDIYYNVTYDDQSYDPDRWLNNWTYSTEPTGIDYSASRGIIERRYEYIKPDGTTVNGKLTRVKEMGAYTFRVAVKDEYGTWSDWAEAILWLDAPPVNHAPFVDITSHTSTDMNNPSGSAGSNPLFTWNAIDYDADSRIVRSEIDVQYYYYNYYNNPQYQWVSQNNPVAARTHNSLSDGNVVSLNYSYPMTVQPNQTYKVRIRVQDEKGEWSGWSERYFAKGFPPAATLTYPNGTQSSPTPITSGILKPSWNQSDADVPTEYRTFQYRILDANGVQIQYTQYGYVYDAQRYGNYAHFCSYDSESNSWNDCDYYTSATTWNTHATEWFYLPYIQDQNGPFQVQVRVHDERYWSEWSNSGWFTTNRPPVASMTIPSGTQAAPTIFSELRPTFEWSQTDPDPGTTFTYFQMQITNEANDVLLLDSGQFYQGTVSNVGSWMVNQELPAGQKLRVRVRVFDGVTWSDYSAQTWFYINRAPVAEFDWNPKPVWEGDVVTSMNTSFDLDGDVLTYAWNLVQPDGVTFTFSTKDISHRFLKPGMYKVSLTVSDGRLSNTLIKMIAAMPLTIHSDVTYTDNWLILHEKSGHQTVSAPKDFYSGEIFIVSSKSSPAPVDEVTAWIDTTGLDGHALYVSERLVASGGDATSFSGELFDAKFQSFAEGLPQGLQTIHFQIRYHNGVVKTEDIPVQIIGNVNKSVGVHRVQ
ncbi:hypothetical protein QFZ77_002811 [Paenibacillus sp. V4I3]|uniref:PKD domain-containing protein n=1 Tax=Paenibacillus sp. V4I3 TaxID=3042305 RepID=UPI00278AD02D|nr:PKD domain-containing protein [Paenibacillus sp. V4I3]MDQ0874152.1 hypothetical protein [Paenibacillus sp. V4I3]